VKLDTDITYAVTVNLGGKNDFIATSGVPAVPYTWVFSTGARTPADFPAYVVSSDPAPAATDVDPKKKEISVTFSRAIAPGDYSWVVVRGGEYPGVHGKLGVPKLSTDRLTATIEAFLAPGTIYALSVNDVNYPGYKDTLGRPVQPYAWYFKTSGTAPASVTPGPGVGVPPGPTQIPVVPGPVPTPVPTPTPTPAPTK
jgi:hypothetical protein